MTSDLPKGWIWGVAPCPGRAPVGDEVAASARFPPAEQCCETRYLTIWRMFLTKGRILLENARNGRWGRLGVEVQKGNAHERILLAAGCCRTFPVTPRTSTQARAVSRRRWA